MKPAKWNHLLTLNLGSIFVVFQLTPRSMSSVSGSGCQATRRVLGNGCRGPECLLSVGVRAPQGRILGR
jgi:hypothetical protein